MEQRRQALSHIRGFDQPQEEKAPGSAAGQAGRWEFEWKKLRPQVGRRLHAGHGESCGSDLMETSSFATTNGRNVVYGKGDGVSLPGLDAASSGTTRLGNEMPCSMGANAVTGLRDLSGVPRRVIGGFRDPPSRRSSFGERTEEMILGRGACGSLTRLLSSCALRVFSRDPLSARRAEKISTESGHESGHESVGYLIG